LAAVLLDKAMGAERTQRLPHVGRLEAEQVLELGYRLGAASKGVVGQNPVRSSRPRMISPPPGRFARALSVDEMEAGSPPAADLTSTEAVSPPASRSLPFRLSRSSAVTSQM
jgi:hypothetical protein